MVARLRQGYTWRMELRIEEQTQRPMLAIRRTVTGAEVGEAVGAAAGPLFEAAGEHATGLMVSRWHTWDDDTGGIMEVGVVTKSAVTPPEGIDASALPAGRAVVTEYVGPYEGLAAAWITFKEKMAAEGHEGGEAPWEEYLSDCSVTPAAELVTRIVWPLA